MIEKKKNLIAGFRHIDLGKWCAEKHLYQGYDEEYKCHVMDEDAVRDFFCSFFVHFFVCLFVCFLPLFFLLFFELIEFVI
jgi:broad-specificity NMP kinase